MNTLKKLPSEVRMLIMQGRWSVFELRDPTFPNAAFVVVTDEDDKFVLSRDGTIMLHSRIYSPPHELQRAYPFGLGDVTAFLNRRSA